MSIIYFLGILFLLLHFMPAMFEDALSFLIAVVLIMGWPFWVVPSLILYIFGRLTAR
jgi:hypothetical protein